MSIILFIAACFGCAATLPTVTNAPVPAIKITAPQAGAVIPGNLGKLKVVWTDGESPAGWVVVLESGGKTSAAASKGPTAVVDLGQGPLEAWSATLRVCRGSDPAHPEACSGPVGLTISRDALHGAVLYRLVEPFFNAAQDSAIVRKDASGGEPEPVFGTRAVCIGCHAYAADGMAAFNIRKGKDRRLVIVRQDASGLRLFDARKIGEFAFLAWSPDSRYLAIVANTFGTIDIRSDIVEPFNLMYQSGDIAIYDRETRQITLLPGASEMDYTEDMPAWSPDGKYLLFVKYQADKQNGIKSMGIYRVPFNGGGGGSPEQVLVPSSDGAFYYFPNYSPDGKWISFVKGDGSRGVFARRTSDIYIMPSGGGEARKLSFNIDGVMDSWHRWSSNSRWLIFSSKRGGDMTALYLSYIDDLGSASPPVMLAQHQDRKVNLPEFVPGDSGGGNMPLAFQSLITNMFQE